MKKSIDLRKFYNNFAKILSEKVFCLVLIREGFSHPVGKPEITWVLKVIPLKQGLKLNVTSFSEVSGLVLKVIPLKQGLKPTIT